MAKKKKGEKTKRRRVTFFLDAPDAQRVILMGDFNQWNEKTHPMKKESDGSWKKIIMIPPGRYEYRFLVDGEWWNDPNNHQICSNCFGTVNNILEVSK
jgi:1,4-alpha-glucan branching enzyme